MMFYDMTVEIRKTKQIFVEADSEEDAMKLAEYIAEEKESDWDFGGDYVSDEIEIDDGDILEFQSLEEARGFYDSGDEIPAYRVIQGKYIEDIEE